MIDCIAFLPSYCRMNVFSSWIDALIVFMNTLALAFT